MAIDIAIIDSGINPWHSHVQGVEQGISFRLDKSGEVFQSEDFRDELGHGTAIAGVIRERNSQARLYAVKIFHQKLEAPAALLLAALQWAISARVKIIHLSLGTEQQEYRGDLKRLCQEAYDKDIVLVAAAHDVDALLVRRAIEEPLRHIAENAGVEGSIVVDKVKNLKGNFGFDAAAEEYADLMKAGVIDPTKVVRTALQNAASVAALLLTTEAMVAEKPEEKEGMGGMPPGMGGGGMPGMM